MPRFPTQRLALLALGAAALLAGLLAAPVAHAQNQPPIADAGNDFSVVPGTDRQGRLNAGDSFDPDGTAGDLSYRWRVLTPQYDWITVTPTGTPRGITAQFEVPSASLVAQEGVGRIQFQLTVTDRDGARSTDLVVVTLRRPPDAVIRVSANLLDPDATDRDGDGRLETSEKYTVDAVIDGPGQGGNGDNEWDVQEGARLVLDGAASTDGGSSQLTYEWRKQTARPNYPAFNVAPGDLFGESAVINLPDNLQSNRTATVVYRLTVTNEHGLTDFATVEITVRDQPAAPTVEIGLRDRGQPAQPAFQPGDDPRYVVAPGDSVAITATADDKDGTQARSLTHQWGANVVPSASNRAGTTSQATFTAPRTDPDGTAHTVTVTVTDSTGRSGSATATFVVVKNSPPAAVAPENLVSEDGKQGGTDGTGVMRVNGAGFDNDGDDITYRWIEVDAEGEPVDKPAVKLVNPDQAIVSFDVPELRGGRLDIILRLTVTDVWGVFDTDTVTITVLGRNERPVADAGADQRVAARAEVELDGAKSSDPDPGDLFTFSWALTGLTVTPPARTTPVGAADRAALDDFWPTAGAYPSVLTASRTARPRFRAPNLIDLTSARLTFTLTVTDREGLTDEDDVTVTVLGRYFSGPVVTGPGFCLNHSLGGPVTYPFDVVPRDGVADICALPFTRREAVARQSALAAFAATSQFTNALAAACRALTQASFPGDSPEDLDEDVCASSQSTRTDSDRTGPPLPSS